MAAEELTKTVEDTVSKVNDELAVGEDLEFQRRWWRAERVIWVFLAAILLLDIAGAFGRGYLARTDRTSPDGSIHAQYERVLRFGTQSKLKLDFGPAAVHDHKIQLWASESLASQLGSQQIVPQPSAGMPDQGGILYTFPVNSLPASVIIGLQPTAAGLHSVQLRAGSAQNLELHFLVMP